MKQYYLFGAGINCIAAIQFFGKQNIVAVIDSDEKKQGSYIEGIIIISLEEYIKRKDNREIIITAFSENKVIENSLINKGIFNYYKSPYMQTGFYIDCDDIIVKLKLNNYETIIFCTMNPISELIIDRLKIKNPNIRVCYIDMKKELEDNIPIIITNQDDRIKFQRIYKENSKNKLVFDIVQIYETKFGFKNDKILKFKNIYKDKRCFIIGNGPSLRYEDLDLLYKQKEICFGVNRIYLSYEYTKWRPNYYIAVDYAIVQNDSKKILELDGIKFVRHFYKEIENWNENGIYEFRGLICQPGEPHISFDIYQGVYIGNTVVYDAIQIALYMGFREIYLLGVDMTTGIRYEEEGSHFYKSPNLNENLGKGNTPEARKCLGYAGKVIEQIGGKLRNATRGGELDELERVDFDSLFEVDF